MTYTNYTITRIERKFWNEFMSACKHYDVSARATLLKHAENVVNDYRKYKSGFYNKESIKWRKRK